MLLGDYKKLEHNEQLFIGNLAVSKVEKKVNVILKWTSRKKLTLNEVLCFRYSQEPDIQGDP